MTKLPSVNSLKGSRSELSQLIVDKGQGLRFRPRAVNAFLIKTSPKASVEHNFTSMVHVLSFIGRLRVHSANKKPTNNTTTN